MKICCTIPELINKQSCLYEFFEISDMKYGDHVRKYKEMWIAKLPGGRKNNSKFKKYLCCFCRFQWQKRWLTIFDDYLLYSGGPKKGQNVAKDKLYFNHSLDFDLGVILGYKKSLRIKTLNRDLVIKTYSYHDLFEILYSLALAKQNGNYSKINKYTSFAPER